MTKFLSIDPGKSKCGLVVADSKYKIISIARIVKSNLLVKNVKQFISEYPNYKVIIGNGTTSKEFIEQLNFLGKDLIIAEERNTTLRSKERYFDIFPLKGFKRFLPKEIFLININLDAISALIIMEDYCRYQFDFTNNVDTKTWKK
ncbi:MAG: hypothetical protein CMK49_03680 [Prochlorococcus sp. SP3034]|nr:hypothetical protein [Prochlorococcus sp. SP3034]|tara:strand:+ start:1018 stop:1455 length:438 start_codon:yes stop_codon:yes gene_type:complete